MSVSFPLACRMHTSPGIEVSPPDGHSVFEVQQSEKKEPDLKRTVATFYTVFPYERGDVRIQLVVIILFKSGSADWWHCITSGMGGQWPWMKFRLIGFIGTYWTKKLSFIGFRCLALLADGSLLMR
jgi:hypothetical protein